MSKGFRYWGKESWEKFDLIKENYKETLIYDFYNHDISKGPLKNYDMGEY